VIEIILPGPHQRIMMERGLSNVLQFHSLYYYHMLKLEKTRRGGKVSGGDYTSPFEFK
jgi:hypothetical protein